MKYTKQFILITILCLSIYTGNAQSLRTREVQKEMNVVPNSTLSIRTNGEYLELKTWDQPKIKITVIATDSSLTKMSEDEILDKYRISIKEFNSFVEIQSQSGTYQSTASRTNTAGFSGQKSPLISKSNLLKIIVSYPQTTTLRMACRYSDIKIIGNIATAEMDLISCNLDANDIKTLRMTAHSCFAVMGNIEKGDIDFKNGNFRALNITDVEMTTSASNVEITKIKKLLLKSTNDEYIIDEAETIEGRKSNNLLRLDKLTGLLDITGSNFDVKLRSIAGSTELIRIIDQYGSLRLPIKGLTNFSVDFRGMFSKAYTDFDIIIPASAKDSTGKQQLHSTMQQAQSISPNSQLYQNRVYYSDNGYQPGGSPEKFSATVGDVKGKHTRFELSCNNCMVDFK